MMATAPLATPRTPVSNPSWQWPIEVTSYDRTPTLSPSEHTALSTLGWDLHHGTYHDSQRAPWRAIERLARPLRDARRCLHIPDSHRQDRDAQQAVGLILYGCAITQRAFWAWSPTTWMELFGTTHQAFRQAYPGWLEPSVRPHLVAVAYLLGCFAEFHLLRRFNRIALANRVFGSALVQPAVDSVMEILRTWGYQSAQRTDNFPGLICELLLYNRSPYLADLTAPLIEHFRHHDVISSRKGATLYGIHRAIAALGWVDPPKPQQVPLQPVEGVDPVWRDWIERWTATSTLTRPVRLTSRGILLRVGRWLAQQHPAVREPAHWTRELCAAYLAQVERLCIGDYVQRQAGLNNGIGRPLSAQTKDHYSLFHMTSY